MYSTEDIGIWQTTVIQQVDLVKPLLLVEVEVLGVQLELELELARLLEHRSASRPRSCFHLQQQPSVELHEQPSVELQQQSPVELQQQALALVQQQVAPPSSQYSEQARRELVQILAGRQPFLLEQLFQALVP